MIQRRGRGRAELSKSVLLTEDPKVVEKEKTNLMREKLMEEAIAKVQNFPPEAFDRALLVNQNTNYRRRKMREDAEAAKRTELSNHW